MSVVVGPEVQRGPQSRRPDLACTLLVASCDRYADLWSPYFMLWRRYWPDCPFPVALITEELQPRIDGVRALALGAGMDWSTLMLRALEAARTPYVLLTLEDFFLRRAVDTGRILSLFEDVQRQDVRMLRLIPRPGPTEPIAVGAEYGAIAPDAPYRVSTQAAFWHVETLRSLLVPGESAWEFEWKGSARGAAVPGFFAVGKAALPYRHHVIERGKWFPWEARRFQRLGIGVDLAARPVMTRAEASRWLIGKALTPVVVRLPRWGRRLLKPIARRLGWFTRS
jgi:hypothetical protein